MEKKIDARIKNLSLLLMYLTGWEERYRNGKPGEMIFRSWEGYPFEILKALESEKLIQWIPKAKSVFLTDNAKQFAREINQKYPA